MRKIDEIKELCSNLIGNPYTLDKKVIDHLCVCAGLIENEITQEGCDDWWERSAADTAQYIRKQVPLCSERTLEDVYFLLLEMSTTVH
jgi:hypothetical protein